MKKFKDEVESRFNGISDHAIPALTSLIFGGCLLLTPAKAMGWVGIGGGIATFISTKAVKRRTGNCAIEMLKEQHSEISKKDEELNDAKTSYKALEAKYSDELAKREKVLIHAKEALAIQDALKQAQDRIAELEREKAQLEGDEEALRDELKATLELTQKSLGEAKSDVVAALIERRDSVRYALKVQASKKVSPLEEPYLTNFNADIDERFNAYNKAIATAENIGELIDLISGGIDDFANIKVRMIKSQQGLIAENLRETLTKVKEANQQWARAGLVPKSDLEKVRKDCDARVKEFKDVAQGEIDANLAAAIEKFEHLDMTDEEIFAKQRAEIERLQVELALAEEAHQFFGISEQSRIGNTIINYYRRMKIILDAIDWDETELGYRLKFRYSRTGCFISPDDLHKNNARHQLKGLTQSLNLPEFKLTERGGYLYLDIQQRHPSKQSAEDGVKRLLKPLEDALKRIQEALEHKPTIRVMGATGEGKGVMTKCLINAFLTGNEWYLRLHDPQHGSSQDHWGIPKVSKSKAELTRALVSIKKQLENRESGEDQGQVFTLDVLDEIDTHLEKQQKREAFIDLISRMRHHKMALIVQGQNPKVGRAGFEWSDMQQMTCIYMGQSAEYAIRDNPDMERKKDKLLKEFRLLQDHYEESNQGMEGHERYLFGLVVIPGISPFWVELPRPDSVEIDVDNKLLGEAFAIPDSFSRNIEYKNNVFSDNKSSVLEQSVATTDKLKPLSDKAIAESSASAVAASMSVLCPKCGASTKKNGKNAKGVQKHVCKNSTCKHGFT